MGITIGSVHHITLTVTDIERSKAFYMDVLELKHVGDVGEKVLLSNNSLLLVLNPPADPSAAPENDSFSEHRCGLDHVSFTVESHAALENARQFFDEKGIPHGDIHDLGTIYVLAFRDPDNIQLEFTAPHA